MATRQLAPEEWTVEGPGYRATCRKRVFPFDDDTGAPALFEVAGHFIAKPEDFDRIRRGYFDIAEFIPELSGQVHWKEATHEDFRIVKVSFVGVGPVLRRQAVQSQP